MVSSILNQVLILKFRLGLCFDILRKELVVSGFGLNVQTVFCQKVDNVVARPVEHESGVNDLDADQLKIDLNFNLRNFF
jgi:hypothetical protein